MNYSEFYKNKGNNDKLESQCKECMSRYRKERRVLLKREAMIFFGGRCTHMDNGIQCAKNADDDLDELELIHPNDDGNEHRNLISKEQKGQAFYKALKDRGYVTDGYDVKVMCKSHHHSLDNTGKKHPRYKEGNFNNPDWLKKKYNTMTIQEIADECGVSRNTISYRMIAFGYLRRKPGQRP